MGGEIMRAISSIFTRIAERFLPDAFVFVFFLSALTFVLGMAQGYGPAAIAEFWGQGFFKILTFTAQATLVLATGFALAHTPLLHNALVAFARIPKNEVQIIIMTTLVMMACSLFSWGFGLVAGAIVARQMGIVHRDKVHYPLVVAATYSGFLVWHGGYSGAIPTIIATPGHFLEDTMGVVPVGETLLSKTNLLIILSLVVIVPLVNILMRPKSPEERKSVPASVDELEEESEPTAKPSTETASGNHPVATGQTPAEWLENSRFVTLILGALAALYLVSYFAGGGGVTLNSVILSFFALGLILTPNARSYSQSFQGGAKASYGIILQFPFYGGIMGMMTGTGLAAALASGFVSISTAQTLPFFSFLGSGLVNMFVPSGGGQWAVQGPIVISAAKELGADLPKVAIGVAWGDAWTNMVQPFWTLPMLAIAGLGIRDIMGYTATVLLVSGAVIGGILLVM